MNSCEKIKEKHLNVAAYAADEHNIRVTNSRPDQALPYVLEAHSAHDIAADAAADMKPQIRALLRRHGAVLMRGFSVAGVAGFEQVVRSLSGPPLKYMERSSPRSAISGAVYTSTDYPADQEIFPHNENSYRLSWPRTLYFFCVEPPDTGGATPLCDIRRVHASIDLAVRQEFSRRRWMVVHNYHEALGMSWQYVFDTQDRRAVEAYCAANGITAEWRPNGGLRTTAVRDAIHGYPGTGEPVWFNHATFFHVSTLPPDMRHGMLALFTADELPSNTYFGDHGTIPDDVIAHLRDCYRAASVRFDWTRGDILVVDNRLAAHGREPFTGPRKIAVAMSEPAGANA
jgi:alpha-ketoglutarate-dependent taurine dioxygenase